MECVDTNLLAYAVVMTVISCTLTIVILALRQELARQLNSLVSYKNDLIVLRESYVAIQNHWHRELAAKDEEIKTLLNNASNN